ncbi:transporter substrate-binding domain-containing protein [Bartonella sp. HY038]|uniref:transporter substrate-binding domain-containing protein n=1 Tax=Bartonella sp. HY038 TaxID=2759660 RepID=UPI0015F8CC7D|nr:transporter substrate-binding domain-containing protein [Bartonella sp. HY038]
MKQIIIIISSLFLSMVSIIAHAQNKPITEVKIGTEASFYPYNFTKPDGTLDGFEIELARYLCEKMQVKCSYVVQPFDSIIPALNAGKFDVIMSGLTNTPKRAEVVDFTASYMAGPQVFATMKNSPLAKLPHDGENLSLDGDKATIDQTMNDVKAALKGHVIGVQTASLAQSLAAAYFKDVATIREYKLTEQHDLDLRSGRVDALIAAQSYFRVLQKKPGFEELIMVGPFYKGGILGEGAGIGLRKNSPELQAMFNQAIAQAIKEGVVKELGIKWFGVDVTP